MYVNEQIISKELTGIAVPHDIQAKVIELNLRKAQWLLVPSYRPPSQNEKYFVEHLGLLVDFYSRSMHNLLVFGDLNLEASDPTLSILIDQLELHSMIKTPTCFKSSSGRCIDLFLTNRKHSFQNSQSFETGFSDHHHLIYTVLKTAFVKAPPKVFKYRNYNHFSDHNFRTDLATELCTTRPKTYHEFEEIVRAKLDKHAPLKTAIFRGNNKPHMSKELKKAIMVRTRLKNKSNQTRTEEDFRKYRRQRNLVVRLSRAAKRKVFSQLDPKEVGKDKNVWKTFKPLFTDKTSGQNKIALVENENIVNDDKIICEIFNSYFVNITDTLPITAPPDSDVEITSTTDRVLH